MSTFNSRVELHDANWQDYVNLAQNLAAIGVYDVITGDNGQSYKLSPGEYTCDSNQTIDAVLSAIGSQTAKVGRRYSVFVSEAVRSKWVGLQPVQSRRSA